MAPSMQKVRIFFCDPDATDSSDDEDDQNPEKEKKFVREAVVQEKEPSSRFQGVRRRQSGMWETAVCNPFTKNREFTYHGPEEEAAETYKAKPSRFHAEMLTMKAQQPVSKHAAFSSSSSMSCVSSSVTCEQKEQEAQNSVGLSMEIPHEPMDESLQNLFCTPKEISMDALLGQIDELPVSDFVGPADELHPFNDFTGQEDMFPVNDFIGASHEPPDDDYIGLADISHLPLPFKDTEFDLDAELDWSVFDFASMEHELENL